MKIALALVLGCVNQPAMDLLTRLNFHDVRFSRCDTGSVSFDARAQDNQPVWGWVFLDPNSPPHSATINYQSKEAARARKL